MRVRYVFSGGRGLRDARVKSGDAASDFFYGMPQLIKRGYDVEMVELSEMSESDGVARIGNMLYQWRVLPHKVDGRLLSAMRLVFKTLKDGDAIVVAGTPLALAFTLIDTFFRTKRTVVGIHAGIFNYRQNRFQKWLMKWLLLRQVAMLFGEGEYSELRKVLGSSGRICVNECGTDINFWDTRSDNIDGDYVLAVGNDSRRDFELLVHAVTGLDIQVKIITRRSINATIPDNVELINGDMRTEILTDVELRSYYQNARCVVIPVVESLQPSGQSVCLQAMSCGRPVILTRTAGLWARDKMRNRENVVMVEPNDVAAMRSAIKLLWQNAALGHQIGLNGRLTVLQHWNMDGWTDRLEQCLQNNKDQ